MANLTKLKPLELRKLRLLVRKTYLRDHPTHLLDDVECDRVIEAMSERTLEKLRCLGFQMGEMKPKSQIIVPH